MTEEVMFGWHHRLNGPEFEQAPGDGEGQGSLACCSLWGCRELDTAERQDDSSNTLLCHWHNITNTRIVHLSQSA